ncbi:hypothetical protein GGF48_004683 [Coemansia sp. RSA 921]|nr:hypothetical protein GGF48_004683 [Coemansia sp. RSA 921]KAJ2722930.1 hypothetical protein H4S00_002615 [Coemansia sp. D1744]
MSDILPDSATVSRVLWQLRDEWDLNPLYSQADTVDCMLAQHCNTLALIDDTSEVSCAYYEKASTAGNSQRMKILSELLVTEVTYVDTLKNVVGVYLNPMREAKVLSETELREIFSNIEVILAFHNDHFLPAVTYAISRPEMAVGSVFLHHSAHFRLYSTYTNNHEVSVKTLSSVASRRAASCFIQSARQDVTQIGQVSLDGHLLTPVQRLPRYRMLLTDLLNNTPPDHSDHEPLFAALKDLNAIIFEVNEKKRAFENHSQLRRLQASISGSAAIPLVAPHRTLRLVDSFCLQSFTKLSTRKSGPAACKRVTDGYTYRYLLFNDILLQCSVAANKDLKLSRVYKFDTCFPTANVIHANELRVVGSDMVMYLKGSATAAQKWAYAINNRNAPMS